MKKIFLFIFLVIFLFLIYIIFIKNKDNNIENILQEPTVLSVNYEIKENIDVPILIYHNIRDFRVGESARDMEFVVSVENFEKQMGYLYENNFQTILMKDLGIYFKGEKDLPKNPIIITFDDGVVSQYENAFPILKKYNQVATFFVFTNAMDRNPNYINWKQLEKMVEEGMEIGSHSNLHPFLTKIVDDKLLEKEIKGSKDELETKLNIEIFSFAYPFGEYNEKIKKILQDFNYKTARGIKNGVEHSKETLYDLDAYFVTSNFERFKKIVN